MRAGCSDGKSHLFARVVLELNTCDKQGDDVPVLLKPFSENVLSPLCVSVDAQVRLLRYNLGDAQELALVEVGPELTAQVEPAPARLIVEASQARSDSNFLVAQLARLAPLLFLRCLVFTTRFGDAESLAEHDGTPRNARRRPCLRQRRGDHEMSNRLLNFI